MALFATRPKRLTAPAAPCGRWPRLAASMGSVLLASPALAEVDALEGTWSGPWLLESGARDSATVRFSEDEGLVVGELVNPGGVALGDLSFDRGRLRVVAEAEHEKLGEIRLDARIEEETRLNGTLRVGDKTGEMQLTKWTFVPRVRY